MQIRQPLFSEQKLPDLSTMSRSYVNDDATEDIGGDGGI